MNKQNNILLAQKYSFNKDLLKGKQFYCVPNYIGKNVLIIKHNKKTTINLPKAKLIKSGKHIDVQIINNSFKKEELTENTVCLKVNNINCSFADLIPILNEFDSFFVDEVAYQGKIIFNRERRRFEFLIYDILTYQEYHNRKGTTPYSDRREMLNMLHKFHTLNCIDIPLPFYYGDNLKQCDAKYSAMEQNNKNIDGYLIYDESGLYKFGANTDVLVKFKGETL